MLFKRFLQKSRPRIVAITVVRNEIDIIESFVRHTATMVDEHLIVDHCSHDGTGEILKSLRAEGIPLTLLSNDDPAYNQPVVTNVLMRKAFDEHGADWVLPLDGDEFIQPPEGADLHESLTDPPKHRGCLTYAFRTYHPHPADDHRELNAARRIGHHFVSETGEYHKILVHRSVAKHEELHIRPGNHHLNIGDFLIPPVVLPSFELAHFPVRSLGQYIRKITMGELGKDAFGKKRKGLGTQKTAPFEQLKHNAEHFFRHALTPDRELALGPVDYRGGELRYTAPEDEIADTIQGVLTMAHDIAIQLGQLRDKTREKGVNPLMDTSTVKLEPVTGQPPMRPAAFETISRRSADIPSPSPVEKEEVFLSK
jgi:hypothetical protein